MCLHLIVFAALLRPMSFYEDLVNRRQSKYLRGTPIPVIQVLGSSDKQLLQDEEEFRVRSQSHSHDKKPDIKRLQDDNQYMHSSLPHALDKAVLLNNNQKIGKTELFGSAVSLSAVPTIENTAQLYASSQNHAQSKENNNHKSMSESEGKTASPTSTKSSIYIYLRVWINPRVSVNLPASIL